MSDCLKILILVVDSSHLGGGFSLPSDWDKSDPNTVIIPLLPQGITANQLQPPWNAFNAVTWTRGNRLAISRVLAASRIGSLRPRLFISYIRQDSSKLADQLFDHLNREGFEVFLDRFSIEPGVDFQVRLTEELSHMGTILVLESRHISRSKWVRYEVDFARAHRLGLLSLRFPGATTITGVDDDDRMPIFQRSLTKSKGVLTQKTLNEVIPWIREGHSRGEHRRRSYLRDTMAQALANHGIFQQRIEPDGTLHARKASGERFAFQMTNVPPELVDFHFIANHRAVSDEKFVIGPASNMDWRRRQPLDWLESVSQIQMWDEGEMNDLAASLR